MTVVRAVKKTAGRSLSAFYLKAPTENAVHPVAVVVIAGELPVITDGDCDSRINLPQYTGIYDQTVVADRGAVKDRGGSSEGWCARGYR